MAIKKIDKETEIIIVNNTSGGFFYQSPNGSLIIDLDNHGDEDYITFGDLKTMMARKRGILEKLNLIITEVVDGECTVDDVVEALRLKDTYAELRSLSDDDEIETYSIDIIENFVIDNTHEKIQKVLMSEKSKVKGRIFEAAVNLYRGKKLTDYNKMQVIAESMGHKDFQTYWMDSETSSK